MKRRIKKDNRGLLFGRPKHESTMAAKELEISTPDPKQDHRSAWKFVEAFAPELMR